MLNLATRGVRAAICAGCEVSLSAVAVGLPLFNCRFQSTMLESCLHRATRK